MSRTSRSPAGLLRLITELTDDGRPDEDAAVPVEPGGGLAVALVRTTRPARTLARHLAGTFPPTSEASVLLCDTARS
jgi:hypothetical protein